MNGRKTTWRRYNLAVPLSSNTPLPQHLRSRSPIARWQRFRFLPPRARGKKVKERLRHVFQRNGLADPHYLAVSVLFDGQLRLGYMRSAGGVQYTVQLGAFRERDAAVSLQQRAAATGLGVRIEEPDGASGWYRVRSGRFASREQAEGVARGLTSQGFEAIVVTGSP